MSWHSLLRETSRHGSTTGAPGQGGGASGASIAILVDVVATLF